MLFFKFTRVLTYQHKYVWSNHNLYLFVWVGVDCELNTIYIILGCFWIFGDQMYIWYYNYYFVLGMFQFVLKQGSCSSIWSTSCFIGAMFVQLKLNGSSSGVTNLAFFGTSLKKISSLNSSQKNLCGNLKVSAQIEYDEEKQTSKDRWGGLAYDTSDDQQDITRGKGMVDTLFQAPMDSGTHYAVMSSYDYISTGLRQ